MLKLIAIRPLPGCRQSALKCLRVGQMYYLCNDFRILEDSVALKDEFVRLLPADFFSLSPDDALNINVSAVVGMNGDGKSTLIELMMRLINNCAHRYGLTYNDRLLRIDGIKAELYYLIDNTIYCIRETADDEQTSLLKCADVSDRTRREWKKEITPVKSVKKMQELFYTIISNYSLYTYNIRDFKEEWNYKIQTDDERERCWLHHLFHKNDGYRTPMTIHPYRDKGNIDINRENELTLQRLAALYIQEPNPRINSKSFRWIGEKYADALLLTDVGQSKLQEKTILQYFKDARPISLLDYLIKKIEACVNEVDDIVLKTVNDNDLNMVEESLDFLTGIDDSAYRDFLEDFKRWALNRKLTAKKVFSGNSDIKLLSAAIHSLSTNLFFKKQRIRRLANKYHAIYKVNTKQLIRLRLIYDICRILAIPQDIVFRDYEDLSYIERCKHYVVYKIINICETYPRYIEKYEKSGFNGSRMVTRVDSGEVPELIAMIKDDNSHITLKLRQCINFIYTLSDASDFLDLVAENNDRPDHTGFLPKSSWRIPFERLKAFYQVENAFPLELLPPPIFKTEIRYKTRGNADSDIPYNYLSSGEKQLLNNVGVLLYHLRNLDSVVKGEALCRNVNIILEEIELYFHPEYQRMIIQTLIEKLQGAAFKNIQNINITFVTHSPYILSDIPKSNVLFLKDGAPTYEMQENTFGANVNSLLKNGFFLPSLPMGEFAYKKINGLFDKLHSGNFDPNTIDQLYAQIMTVGEPAIRMQLMTLLAPFRLFNQNKKGLIELLKNLTSDSKQ